MAVAIASPRAQRSVILASPLLELTGLLPGSECRRDRMFAVSQLASFLRAGSTVGEVLAPHGCSGGCVSACAATSRPGISSGAEGRSLARRAGRGHCSHRHSVHPDTRDRPDLDQTSVAAKLRALNHRYSQRTDGKGTERKSCYTRVETS
jgi:hypothetical protein